MNEVMPFATWMDLEIVILSEGSQTEKGKYHDMLTCGIFKNDTNANLLKKRDSGTMSSCMENKL